MSREAWLIGGTLAIFVKRNLVMAALFMVILVTRYVVLVAQNNLKNSENPVLYVARRYTELYRISCSIWYMSSTGVLQLFNGAIKYKTSTVKANRG